MTNISKRKLNQEHQEQLFQQLVKLTQQAGARSAGPFLSALFTESEQTMFIKRTAAILLLANGQSSYRVSKTLFMSESTINKIRLRYEVGEYTSIIKLAQSKEFDSQKFWNTLEILLRAGLPPRTKDKWKYVPGFGG